MIKIRFYHFQYQQIIATQIHASTVEHAIAIYRDFFAHVWLPMWEIDAKVLRFGIKENLYQIILHNFKRSSSYRREFKQSK